VIFSTIFSSN